MAVLLFSECLLQVVSLADIQLPCADDEMLSSGSVSILQYLLFMSE